MRQPRTLLFASLALGLTAAASSAQVVSGVAIGPVVPQASAPVPTSQVPAQFDPLAGMTQSTPAISTTGSPSADGNTHAVDFTAGSGTCGNNGDQTIGWQFDVTAPITVTDMTWADDGLNGLDISHEVAIWDPAGNMIASTNVTIPAGTTAPLDGNWRYVAIAPTVLAPGNGYIVGGYNGSAGNTECLNANVTQVVIPSITYVDATFTAFGPTLDRPTNFSSAVNGFYGVGFRVDSGGPSGNCTDFELGAPCVFSQTNHLTNQIPGLTFAGPNANDGGAVLDQCGNFGVNARSGTNFLAFNRNATNGNGGTPTDPENVMFSGTVNHVEIYVSGGGNTDNFTMQAFAGNTMVASSNVAGPGGVWTLLEVNAPGITRIRLTQTGDCCFVYDDLCWTPEGGQNCTDFELGAPCIFNQTVPLTNQIPGFVASGPTALDGGAVLDTCGNFGIQPQSGVNFLAFNRAGTGGVQMQNGGFPNDPETITFNSPVSSVDIVGSGGTFFPGANFRMDAFNGAALVDTDNVSPGANWGQLSVSAGSITHVVLTETTGAGFFVYDDMCWGGGGPGPIGQNFQCSATVPNSTNQPGVITAVGSETASDNDVKLIGTQLPNNQFGYFLNSPNQNPAGFIPPGSQGRLCIGPQSIGRYNQPGSIFNTMGTGMGMLQLDLPNTPTPTGNVSIVAGQTWYFTCWFRDNNPGSTSNFTDAVCITFN